jgi:hypothetical protein
VTGVGGDWAHTDEEGADVCSNDACNARKRGHQANSYVREAAKEHGPVWCERGGHGRHVEDADLYPVCWEIACRVHDVEASLGSYSSGLPSRVKVKMMPGVVYGAVDADGMEEHGATMPSLVTGTLETLDGMCNSQQLSWQERGAHRSRAARRWWM